MNEKDTLKELRLQEELQFLNSEFIESLAKSILDDLTKWANDNIFGPKGGKLTYSITLGEPNAAIAQGAADPYSPRMEIRRRLLEEIYRDAFAFTLISNRLATETDTLQTLHATDPFKDSPYVFETALPTIKLEWVAPMLRHICAGMEDASRNAQDERLGSNEVRCRFIMFEFMVVWTFFHEIGHALQQHYVLRKEESHVANLDEAVMDWDMETHSSVKSSFERPGPEYADQKSQRGLPNLPAQARELMADIEGTGIMLSYLVADNRLNLKTIYLLLCSLSCMFQRFYNGYEDNLQLAPLRHPHPAIRDEVAQQFILETVVQWLLFTRQVSSSEAAFPPLIYLNVRSSVITGIFRSHRIEKRDGWEAVPSYMKLLSEESRAEMNSYITALFPHVQKQISQVMGGLHLVPTKSVLPRWQQELQRRVEAISDVSGRKE